MSGLKFDKFLLFGDSITEFSFNNAFQASQGKLGQDPLDPLQQQFAFGSALVNLYARKMELVQRGFSGYTSRWALKLLPEVLDDVKNIKMAYIFFGSNDCILGGNQVVPLEEYIENTEKLVAMLKAQNIKPILITPAVYDHEKWNMLKKEEVAAGFVRTLDRFALYANSLVDLGSKLNVPVVNLNAAFMKYAVEKLDGRWQELLCDGLHFSGHGSYVMYNELLKTIEKSYPEHHPKNVPYRLPNWRGVAASGDNLEL
ncbi:hypothetical protein ACO0RG_004053 [Hanseniaspora osmophila]|uniref:Isoamyl acetate-hydrolyzing esterase n=1 Tax=Hanseniaspora osmophila TaxID=56408 RepID=A0A1E5RBW7_9ASCO|nr:Isoamyl acetate-hydrolyzing esterase [Hanseniaspora osmophila]